MSIFQYSFHLVPNTGIEDYKEVKSDIGEMELFDDEKIWREKRVKYSDLEKVECLPKETKSWSEKCKNFGDHESEHAEIWIEDGMLLGVNARLDFRKNASQFLRTLTSFAAANNFVILSAHTLDKLPLDAEKIHQYVTNSKEAKLFFGLPNSLSDPELMPADIKKVKAHKQ